MPETGTILCNWGAFVRILNDKLRLFALLTISNDFCEQVGVLKAMGNESPSGVINAFLTLTPDLTLAEDKELVSDRHDLGVSMEQYERDLFGMSFEIGSFSVVLNGEMDGEIDREMDVGVDGWSFGITGATWTVRTSGLAL